MNLAHRILLPARLGLSEALAFTAQLASLPDAPAYNIDVGDIEFVEPFGMLLVGAHIRRLRSRLRDRQFVVSNTTEGSYEAKMGLYRYIGVDQGGMDTAPGPGNIPISSVKIADLRAAAAETHVVVQEVVEQRAREMARVLCQSESGAAVDILTFSVREALRNVVEHSGSPTVLVCGQYWPQVGRSEIAMLDFGVGIRETLSRNPRHVCQTDGEALALSLQPAVTGTHGRRAHYDTWENSGFGLHMLSSLGARTGDFFIGSYASGLRRDSSGLAPTSFGFDGTALRLTMSIPPYIDSSELIRSIAQEGDKSTLHGVGHRSASKSTLLPDRTQRSPKAESE